MALVVKNLPPNVGDIRDVSWIPGWEDALEAGMATPSSILAWRIPWTEEPGGLPSTGSQRVRHDWSDLACVRATRRYHWTLMLGPGPEFQTQLCLNFFTSKSGLMIGYASLVMFWGLNECIFVNCFNSVWHLVSAIVSVSKLFFYKPWRFH